MKRNFRSAAIVGAGLLLAVAACGNNDGDSSGSDNKELVVAVPLPLTSGNSAVAEQLENVAKLAAEKVNADGGAGGRNVVVKFYDDKLTADDSAKVVQRAITVDHAEVVIGGYTSIEGLAIRQITEPKKIIYMNPSTISPSFTEGATYTYRVAHNALNYPEQIIQLLKDNGLNSPVVIADDAPTGAALAQPTIDAAKAAGMDPKGIVEYKINQPDLSGPVSQLADSGADSVISIGSSSADQGLTVKTMAEQGILLPVVGFGSLIAPDALKIGGDAYAQMPKVITVANGQPSKPQYADFADAYAKEFNNGDPVDLVEQAPQYYDAFEILKKVLDETGGDTDGDEMRAALDGLAPFEGAAGKTGSMISFASGHDAFENALVAFEFVDGKPVEQ